MADLSKGRFWALTNKKCPMDVGGICADCPDSCPLGPELKKFRKDKLSVEVVGRNNPLNHPEDFIDEYEAIYNDSNYKMDCGVMGFFFREIPEHWHEFVSRVINAIAGRED